MWPDTLFFRCLGASERPLDPTQHMIGKAHMQQIAIQTSNVRPRIMRLVLASSSSAMHVGRHMTRKQQICNAFTDGLAMVPAPGAQV